MDEDRIDLKSGSWKWRVAEPGSHSAPHDVENRPTPEAGADVRPADHPVLLLEDPTDPGHWMTRELDRVIRDEAISAEEVGSLARDPDRRQFVDRDGTVWKIERIGEPASSREDADVEHAPRRIRVTSEAGLERTITMPEGRYLGNLTRDELIQLVGSGPSGSRSLSE